MRLFAALTIPDDVRAMLAVLGGGVPGARWMDAATYHITLRFIGEVDPPVAEEIDAALAVLQAPGFTLQLAGVGQFDTGGKPRVLWAGVETNPALIHLARKIDRAVVSAGLPPEDRNYTPHVTLARLRDTPPGRVTQFLADHALLRPPAFVVDRFVLFESLQGNEGPVYVKLAEYALHGV